MSIVLLPASETLALGLLGFVAVRAMQIPFENISTPDVVATPAIMVDDAGV
jgi:hypothetical protein